MAEKLPKVLVVGVTMPQFRQLQVAVRNKTLLYVDKEKNFSLPEADYYVVWVKFVKHKVSRKIADEAGTGRYWFHHLGLKELIGFLIDLEFSSVVR